MMNYFLFGAVACVCIAGAALVAKRYGLGRRCGRAATGNALREMYGQYWSEVRALAQRRMLNAESDEEWLADIRARASASSRAVPRRLRTANTSQSVSDPVGTLRVAVFGLILDCRQKKLEAKSATMPALARQELYRDPLRKWLGDAELVASHRDMIMADPLGGAYPRAEDTATVARTTLIGQEARLLLARIEADRRSGSLKHQRLRRWMRWIPTLITGLDFCLLLYFFASVTRLHWADPQTARLVLVTVLAGTVAALSFGCSFWAGRRMRACKSHEGAVSFSELDTAAKATVGAAAAVIVGISVLMFIQIRTGVLYALGASNATAGLLASLAMTIMVGLVNFFALAVHALDGSDELAFLARLVGVIEHSRSARRTWWREALFHWAPRLGGATVVLVSLATGLYLLHPAVAVVFVAVPIWVVYHHIIHVVWGPSFQREERLSSWNTALGATVRRARPWSGFMTARSSPLQPDDADRV
jgi:hypothetical protein